MHRRGQGMGVGKGRQLISEETPVAGLGSGLSWQWPRQLNCFKQVGWLNKGGHQMWVMSPFRLSYIINWSRPPISNNTADPVQAMIPSAAASAYCSDWISTRKRHGDIHFTIIHDLRVWIVCQVLGTESEESDSYLQGAQTPPDTVVRDSN